MITIKKTPAQGDIVLTPDGVPMKLYASPNEILAACQGGDITLQQISIGVQRMATGGPKQQFPPPNLPPSPGHLPVLIDSRNQAHYMTAKEFIDLTVGKGRNLAQVMGRMIRRVELSRMVHLERAFQ